MMIKQSMGNFADHLQNIRPDWNCQSAPGWRSSAFLSVLNLNVTLSRRGMFRRGEVMTQGACSSGQDHKPLQMRQWPKPEPQAPQIPKPVKLQDDICGGTALKSMFVGAPGP